MPKLPTRSGGLAFSSLGLSSLGVDSGIRASEFGFWKHRTIASAKPRAAEHGTFPPMLQPHEFPHLNPKWNDVFVEGDVFTVEPGLYSKEINGGIWIENQYLFTQNGVENLVDFPMELI
jgi:hypothetical protein